MTALLRLSHLRRGEHGTLVLGGALGAGLGSLRPLIGALDLLSATDAHPYSPSVAALRFAGIDGEPVADSRGATFERLVDDLERELRALPAPIDLVGVSMSGHLALAVAARRALPVRSVVTISTAPRPVPDADAWARRMDSVAESGMGAVVDGLGERWFSPRFRERNRGAVDRIVYEVSAASPGAYAELGRALTGVDLTHRLDGLPVPVLAVAGGEDPSIDAGALQRWVGRLGNGWCTVLPDGRHQVAVDHASETAEAIRAFWIRLRMVRPSPA